MPDAMQKYDDRYCLLRISEGDEKFFDYIFQKYRNKIFIYLFKITKSKETAEETVLDVFLKLWHGRAHLAEIENLEGFLFKVAHNKAIDFLRSAKRNPVFQQELWETISQPGKNAADQKIVQSQLQSALQRATKQLSSQREKVFQLRNEEGLSYAEIAERLQLSSNTVRNHLAASVQFIKELLRQDDLLLLVCLFLLRK